MGEERNQGDSRGQNGKGKERRQEEMGRGVVCVRVCARARGVGGAILFPPVSRLPGQGLARET